MVPIRFLQLGVQPFLIASTLRMALSQCLVKMVCPHCHEEVPIPSREKLKKMRINPAWLEGAEFFQGGTFTSATLLNIPGTLPTPFGE